MVDWGITGISVALIDDQRTVHAAGYGEAKRDSIFRCGSISKLFNAVAVMQLVEAGKLSLDAPVAQVDPRLVPVSPFTNAEPVTLRQLLCHRSGLFRESPVGGYFDGSEPGFERMVASVKQGVLVNPPNTKTRYSNVGPSIAGRVVEIVAGQNYPEYQRDHVLKPLGATSSAWVDLDRDGWLDFVVANGNDMAEQRVAVYYNQGDGTFPATPDWQSDDTAYHGHLDVADLNGDGWPDVAVSVLGNEFTTDKAAKLYLNNGGTFAGALAWTDIREKWIPSDVLVRWDRTADGQGILFYAISLVIPLVPNDAMCHVAGLGRITHCRFSVANLLGRGMACLITWIGAFGLQAPSYVWVVIVLLGVLAMFLWQLARHMQSKNYAF